jgi:hypothetical protein
MPSKLVLVMTRLRIMHLNVGKRRLVQYSLLNDETIKDFDAIAVVEPYIF